MKIPYDVSSVNGKSFAVYGGNKTLRNALIDNIIKNISTVSSTRVVLDSAIKTINVEMIREFIESSQYSSLQASSLTFYIVLGAEKLSSIVQNMLLKTLEEVPLGKTFILESSSLEMLLPTIQSRVFAISVDSVQSDASLDIESWREKSLGELFVLAEEYAQSSEKAQQCITELIQFMRSHYNRVSEKPAYTHYTEFLLTNYGLIGSTNTSVRLILENCVLHFHALFRK